MEEAHRKVQPARGQGRLQTKSLSQSGHYVLASHGQVTEQPYAINLLELWPKRISQGLNQEAARGMPEGVGAVGLREPLGSRNGES